MSDQAPLVNIGELARPATVLIEKISDAIGGVFKPYQMKRIAQAEAEVYKTKAVTQIEITELQRRGMQRLFIEEAKKQNNIESITAKALPQLGAEADPKQVEDDWITHFFDRCRLISDDQMQGLWAKVLAGEANSPGKYSKRTVSLLGSLDKSDATLFTKLCGFAWIHGTIIPLVYDNNNDIDNDIYNRHGINFDTLKHLDEIGLVSFSSIGGYRHAHLPKRVQLLYYGTPIIIEFVKDDDNDLDIGQVLLSKAGRELAPICGPKPVPDFLDYVIGEWSKKGYVTSSQYPRGARNA